MRFASMRLYGFNYISAHRWRLLMSPEVPSRRAYTLHAYILITCSNVILYCNVYSVVKVSILFRQIFAIINSHLGRLTLINATLWNSK